MGVLAYALTPFTVLLGARESILTMLTGIPYQHFNFLHRWTGRVIFVQSVIHTIGWTIIEGKLYEPQPKVYAHWLNQLYAIFGLINQCEWSAHSTPTQALQGELDSDFVALPQMSRSWVKVKISVFELLSSLSTAPGSLASTSSSASLALVSGSRIPSLWHHLQIPRARLSVTSTCYAHARDKQHSSLV